MIMTRTRAIGIIVISAQSEFNLVGSSLYGGKAADDFRCDLLLTIGDVLSDESGAK
jgi:hypothetical protein